MRVIWDNIEKISQLGLLILAVIGYVYTVIPVYQKELLSEQIAYKEKELEQQRVELKNVKLSISQIQDDLDIRKAKIAEQEEILKENLQLIDKQQQELFQSNKQIGSLNTNAKYFEEKATQYYKDYRKQSTAFFAMQWAENIMKLDYENLPFFSDFKAVIPSGLKDEDKALLLSTLKKLDYETKPKIQDIRNSFENAKKTYSQELKICIKENKQCNTTYEKYLDAKDDVRDQYFMLVDFGIKKISRTF